MIFLRAVASMLLVALWSTLAQAQDFPSRLVRIVVPYPAGGGVDGLARPLADRLSKKWQQTVIVENKPGASTMIGGEFVARAPADGYTLLFTSDSSITSNPFLFKKRQFRPDQGSCAGDPAHRSAPDGGGASLRVRQHDEGARRAGKEKPNTLNYGSYGNGSQPHLLFEMLRAETGAQIMQIPYRGIAPAITATIAGDVQMTLGGAATTRRSCRRRSSSRSRSAGRSVFRHTRACHAGAKPVFRTSTRNPGSGCSRRVERRAHWSKRFNRTSQAALPIPTSGGNSSTGPGSPASLRHPPNSRNSS